MTTNTGPSPGPNKDRVQAIEADAEKMMQDLSALSAKLKAVGKAKAEELSSDAVSALNDQLKTLQDKLGGLTKDSEQIIGQLDKSVRANPYLYIAGALGLGLLLGKILRS